LGKAGMAATRCCCWGEGWPSAERNLDLCGSGPRVPQHRVHPGLLICRAYGTSSVASQLRTLGYSSSLSRKPIAAFPRRLFCHRLMVVADRARYLPCAVFVLPQGYELGLSHAIFRAVRMVEAMNANLH